MITTREAAVAALLAALTRTGLFMTVGRRNRRPESFKPDTTPALMLLDHSNAYRNPSERQPSVRSLMLRALVYSDVGPDENAIPSAVMNAILDQVDAALARDPATGACTLGGVVKHAMIDGTIILAPGEVTGKSLASIPITLLLP